VDEMLHRNNQVQNSLDGDLLLGIDDIFDEDWINSTDGNSEDSSFIQTNTLTKDDAKDDVNKTPLPLTKMLQTQYNLPSMSSGQYNMQMNKSSISHSAHTHKEVHRK
jgi:hypothetical protein